MSIFDTRSCITRPLTRQESELNKDYYLSYCRVYILLTLLDSYWNIDRLIDVGANDLQLELFTRGTTKYYINLSSNSMDYFIDYLVLEMARFFATNFSRATRKMGIKSLMKTLSEEVSGCIREVSMQQLGGRIVAIDASMALYQFLIAVRSNDGSGPSQMLTNEAGEVTSHIQGMFNRTIRLMENGIKPVYVFDGKAPTMKGGELAKRTERRQQAKENLQQATEQGNAEDVDKFTRRLVRVTADHNNDCKQLLRLMGVPLIEAPCEAEATCAELAKKGLVFAAGTEDMDALTFGTPFLLRRMTIAASRKLPVLEINLEKALSGLGLSQEQFIDFCILCGCDYCDTIRGIGPKKALNAIREHKSIEKFVEYLQETKPKGVVIPESWLTPEDPIYAQARLMFTQAEVADCSEIKLQWNPPNEEELKEFLVGKCGFSADRVENAIKKLKKAKTTHSQQRLESFFKVIPSTKRPASGKAKPATNGKKKKTDSCVRRR